MSLAGILVFFYVINDHLAVCCWSQHGSVVCIALGKQCHRVSWSQPVRISMYYYFSSVSDNHKYIVWFQFLWHVSTVTCDI